MPQTKKFSEFIDAIKENSKNVGQSIGEEEGTVDTLDNTYNIFEVLGLKDPFDKEKLYSEVFDRSEASKNVATQLDKDGENLAGKVASNTMEATYLASAQKALDYMNRSKIECTADMATRKTGHGTERGVFKGVISKAMMVRE